MLEQLKPINCPECGQIMLRDPPDMKEYRLRCEKCKKDYKTEPKVDWEFWVLIKKELNNP